MASRTPPEPVLETAIRIDSHLGGADERSLADDVLDGLTRPFKELPPKHFYDARGAELFDRICELPEYYPTRAERAILEQNSHELAALTQAAELVELGSGTASKTRVLLERAARSRDAAPLRAGRRDREHGARMRGRADGRVPGAAGPRRDRRLRTPSRRDPGVASDRGSSPFSAARSATSRRAAGDASCARSRGCSDRRITC